MSCDIIMTEKQLLDLPKELLCLIIKELDFWSIFYVSKTCTVLQDAVETFKTNYALDWNRIREEERDESDNADDWDDDDDDELTFASGYSDEIPSFGSNYDDEEEDEYCVTRNG